MTTFNMQEFNEILEKCKDQSQQQKQDQVKTVLIIETKNNSYQLRNFLSDFSKFLMMNHLKREMTMTMRSIFRRCCNRSCTSNRFLESKFGQSSDSPSTFGSTSRLISSRRSPRLCKCSTIRHCCKFLFLTSLVYMSLNKPTNLLWTVCVRNVCSSSCLHWVVGVETCTGNTFRLITAINLVLYANKLAIV